MNLQAIFVANITGFLLILSLLISQMITCRNNRVQDRIFSWMMYLVLVACLVEPITFYIDGREGALYYWINLLGNTYLYGANVVGSFLFCVYVDENLYHSRERVRMIYQKFAIVVALIVAALIVNIKYGYFFYVDADNVYHRTPITFLFYIYVIVCSLFSVMILFCHRRKYGKVAFFPMYMYLTPIITGSALQMAIYGISLAWLGTAIGVVALYMSILSQSSYLDSLTGLYNRLFLTHSMSRMEKRSSMEYYGIMLDMDNFKSINDTYGHSAGDRALKDAAGIFARASAGVDTRIFRYAGDEFIILYKTRDEEDIIKLEDSLRSEAEEFNNSSNRPYRIGFSMGHARYERGTDTNDTFLKKIDDAMYANKEERRIESGIERRKN